MVGNTSFFNTCLTVWGKNLERLTQEHVSEIMGDLQNILDIGGCFEDEGFLSTTCDGEVITIKPLTWFRSRREALELIMMINRLEK